jgi:predicted transposase YdaD
MNEEEQVRLEAESRENFLWEQHQLENAAEAKGKAKGKAEGENNKAIQIAKNLILMELSDEQIAKGTGLTIEQIQKLRKE